MDTSTKYREVQVIQKIADFEPDQYGNEWYNVKFVGDNETYMWLAKSIPTVGEKYYCHLESTKSGKRYRVKTDKKPEQEQGSKSGYQPKDDNAIKAMFAIKAAIQWLGPIESSEFKDIQPVATELYAMVDKVKGIAEFKEDIAAGSIGDDPLKLDDLNDVFPN